MLKNKLPLIIFAVIAIGLLVWGVFVFKQRNTAPANNNIQQEQTQDQEQTQSQPTESSDKTNIDTNNTLPDSASNLDENSSDDNTPVEKTNLLDITSKDCAKNCKDYTDNPENLKYCKEFCGLDSEKNDGSGKDCDNLSDVKRDYCLKNLAISENDLLKYAKRLKTLEYLKFAATASPKTS